MITTSRAWNRRAAGWVAVLGVAGWGTAPCFGQALWDESTQGDLSNDRTLPTALSLSLGNNTLKATTGSGDREYFRFSVAGGTVLSSVTLDSYAGVDGTAFFGIQTGTSITESPTSPVVGNLLGWAHFGTGPGNVGANLLPTLGTAPGAQGFIPPLASGDYAVWVQQLGSPATYQFNLAVSSVPEPAAVTGVAAGGLVGLAAWRRGQRRDAASR